MIALVHIYMYTEFNTVAVAINLHSSLHEQ